MKKLVKNEILKLRIPDEIKSRWAHFAKARNMTFSELIRQAVTEYIKNHTNNGGQNV